MTRPVLVAATALCLALLPRVAAPQAIAALAVTPSAAHAVRMNPKVVWPNAIPVPPPARSRWVAVESARRIPTKSRDPKPTVGDASADVWLASMPLTLTLPGRLGGRWGGLALWSSGYALLCPYARP